LAKSQYHEVVYSPNYNRIDDDWFAVEARSDRGTENEKAARARLSANALDTPPEPGDSCPRGRRQVRFQPRVTPKYRRSIPSI
jgi:hypothetical protein